MRARGLGARRRAALIGACSLLCGAALAVAGPAQAGPLPRGPHPGGGPNAAVPVPPSGKFFGYHENSAELGTHGWTPAELAEVARGGGANLLRFHLDWWNVEPQRDKWGEVWWGKYARLYDALRADGMRPLITLGGVPPWARPASGLLCGTHRGCEYPPEPGMDDEWAEFAAEVARRFPETAAIEIWNEPNTQEFWKPLPSPWRYAQLVAAAYPAIKAANPNVRVLTGGLAPTQRRVYDLLGKIVKMPMRQFLQAAYTATPSIKDKIDGISFHTVFNQLDYGAESLWAKAFWDVRSTAAAYGDTGIELWLSETGLTTSGPQAYSETQQAAGLVAQYRRLMTMPDLKGMVIHTLAERVEMPPTDPARGHGLVRSFSPFGPKQGFCEFAGRVATSTPYGGCPPIVDTGPGDDPGGEDPGGGGGGSPRLNDFLH